MPFNENDDSLGIEQERPWSKQEEKIFQDLFERVAKLQSQMASRCHSEA